MRSLRLSGVAVSTLFTLGAMGLGGCAATVPKAEADAALATQRTEYEARLFRAEEERRRADLAREAEHASAKERVRVLEARVSALESALAEKQRWLQASAPASALDARRALERPRGARAAGASEARVPPALVAFPQIFASHRGARVEVSNGAVVIRVPDGVFFSRGATHLAPEARATVVKLKDALGRCDGCALAVFAYTDSILATEGDEDTWAVTGAQGRALVLALQTEGADPSRLSYASFGQFRPIASNESEEGRAENRRIELIVHPGPPVAKR